MQWFKIIFFLEIIFISFCASNIILNQDLINNYLVNHYLKKYSKEQQGYEEPLSSLEKIIPPTGEMGTDQPFGQPMRQNPSDPEYYKLAEESLAQYSKSAKQNYKPTKITKVFQQIVAGVLTTIYFEASATNCDVDSQEHPTSSECAVQNENDILSCISVILETPWLRGKEIGVKCFPDGSDEVTIKHGQDKEEFIHQPLARLTPQDPKDPEYFKLAEESLAKFTAASGIRKNYKPFEIVEVTQQVVAGVLTRIDFKASADDCDSTEQPKSSFCDLNDILLCHSEIWEQSWTNKREIDVACEVDNLRHEHTAKGRTRDMESSPLRGQIIQDVNNRKYYKLAEKSHAKHFGLPGITQQYKPTEIESNDTTTQRRMYSRANDDLNPLPGGELAQDVNDSKYSKLAEKSLNKYFALSGMRNLYEITEIVKVTTQVVAGLLTRIDFKASASNCEDCEVIYCKAEIWEQPWLNNIDDIDISCSPIKRTFGLLVP